MTDQDQREHVDRSGPPITEPSSAPRAVAILAVPSEQGDDDGRQDEVIAQATEGLLRVGSAVVRVTVSAADGMYDYRAAIDAAARRYPALAVWAVGYSDGAAIALAAGATDARISRLVGIGTLVDDDDLSVVRATDKATFLIHGERDERCSMKAVRRFYGELTEPRELVVIDMADHAFDGHASEVADALEDLLSD